MTAIDWSNPVEVAAEASRRMARRAAGQPLSPEPEPVDELEPASARAWPMAVIRNGDTLELPRPRSLALEKNEQAEVVKVFQRFGVKRWKSTSQARKSKIGLGIADLWVFGPVHNAGHWCALAWWWETKSGEGWRFSAAQLEFAYDCETTETLYGCGDRFAAEVFCRALGLKEL